MLCSAPPGMVLVSQGRFLYGITKSEVDQLVADYPGYDCTRYEPEIPQREIWLPSFAIDIFPVTNRDYAQAVRASIVPAPVLWDCPEWRDPDAPVIGVNWFEATRYARWRGKQLPSEAQWEKAASWDPATQTKRRYPWGNTWEGSRSLNAEELLGRPIRGRNDWQCEFWNSGVGISRGRVERVGMRDDASPYGVRMLVGHVWEWTRDGFEANSGVPKHPLATRVLRGGSWADDRNSCRTSYRAWSGPEAWRYGPTDVGFRCILE